LDEAENGVYKRQKLCTRLASIALRDRDAKILEALLEVHGDGNIEMGFHRDFDILKHEGKDPEDAEIVRIIENSKFESIVPPGERFRFHPMEFMY
jgi:hypothetical protein